MDTIVDRLNKIKSYITNQNYSKKTNIIAVSKTFDLEYIKPLADSGHIHFLDPRPQHRIASPDLPNRPDPPASNTEESGNPYAVTNSYDSSVFTYKIKEGKIIIFPSWLMHYVDPNPNDSTRVSIAFNAKYISNYEYSEK